MRPDFPFRPSAFPFFYGWVILVVSTVGIVMSIPGQTMGVGVFTDHLIDATGLSRLEISNAYLVGTLASGLMLPWGGTLVDRFGARRVVIGACTGLAASLCFLASSDYMATRIAGALPFAATMVVSAVLALGFTALRFSGQGMLTLVSRTMLGKWFERGRGIVAAASGPFVSIGFAASPQLLLLWIDRSGWRQAWLEMAVVVGAGMGLIGWLFYRDTPEQCGLRMYGADGRDDDASPEIEEERDFTRKEALRTSAFWLVTLAVANQSMVGTGIVFHITSIGAEAGLDRADAVSIFLPVAIVTAATGFLVGASVERFPVRLLIGAMMLGQLVMFAGVGHLGDPLLRAITIGGWGFASGFFGPLTVAVLPAFFGRTHLGAIQGAQMMILVVASALGPSLLAVTQSQLGSWRPGLYAVCVLPALVLLLAVLTPDPRHAVSRR